MITRRRIALSAASIAAVTFSTVSAELLDLDFNNNVDTWRVVVDGVMGGRSTGRVASNEPGILRFSGDLSLENNGGFSQIRTNVAGSQFEGAVASRSTSAATAARTRLTFACRTCG